MFSVLSLNLRFGLADDGPNSWPFRQKAYPLLLKQYQSDFICFQEANDFQIDFLGSLLTGYKFIGQRENTPKFWQSDVIFYSSAWECLQKEHFFLSDTPEIPSKFKESRWPRQCTLGWFEKENRQLICVNTHFDFDSEVQVKSAELILERLSAYPAHVPVILTGDYNSDPSSACFQVFTAGKAGKTLSISSPFQNTFPRPFPGTYHGFTGKSQGGHIDWILYKGPISLIHSQIIPNDFKGRYPSDHFPLRAVFDFEKQGDGQNAMGD
ncbi:MAG: endonuclease/exonuclease/phosphatase family protein [Proteobacteria bacterium]|nr:endonuclease/exonuclease/phosphatase family protein [Pseudomonadota bacterium]MBU4469941.1 endonuclease/exonuclease/phosphatase family protein [Pseudomonadota bacterium]MCG2753703.1 endonuclease/exonuclease/phosphatase family protein [Desulfobacteraceae bacterium]